MLMRWSPDLKSAREFSKSYDEVDRFINSFFGSPVLRSNGSSFVPAVDVQETQDAYLFRADLPGVAQKDIKVSVMGDTLNVSGERRQETTEKDGSYHRVERVSGSFERSFTLPAPVRADQVKASYKDGVLEITVPKAEEAKPREIEIKVG
jgi:HSP20 family protein